MYTLKEIEIITDGKIINGDEATKIEKYSLAKEYNEKGSFYFPIIFKNVDREIFILDHVRNGAIGFLINKNSKDKAVIIEASKWINPDICIVEVDSVNDALYKLGLKSRENNCNKPIIAVTGSVGKTTLCSLISQILETEIKVLHDFKNENNNTRSHISLSFFNLEYYDMAVIEVGISDFGIMEQISELIKPSIAVINSIGTAHLNRLKSKDNILQEKLHITDFIKDDKILFVNKDDEYLKDLISTDEYELRQYSKNEAKNICQDNDMLNFEASIYGKKTMFKLNLYGEHNVSNIILAIKIAEKFNIKYENIVKAINNFKPINGRLKVFNNLGRKITLIDDSYSSSFESVKMGLSIASNIDSKRKIAVLGKMAALGEQAGFFHEEVGKYFGDLNFDYLYLTGEYTKHIFKGALNSFKEKNIKKVKNNDVLIKELEKNINDGDLIYVKAARTQNFEEIVMDLKEKFNMN